MSENGKRGLALPITWSVICSGAIGLIAWGSNSERITNLEKTDVELKANVEKHGEKLSAHASAIAVTDARYAEILRRLEALDRKLGDEP